MDRRRVLISGIVQGVGFRPFVYAAAHRRSLTGFVRNEADGVQVEVEGAPAALDDFLNELSANPPAGSRIESVEFEWIHTTGSTAFVIEPSREQVGSPAFVPVDVATCPACVAELFNPSDRRFKYPFLSCAHCGPRFTIISALPYDRERTTMAGFALCSACRSEYEDPEDRRFHAQTTACRVCGPRLAVLDVSGTRIETPDPLDHAITVLKAGQIVAVKGLGGFHLACDARRESTIAELRRRKHRDEKPLAIMVADLAAAEILCEFSSAEAQLLSSPPRPIVLLNRRADCGLPEGIAQGNNSLG